MARTSRGVWFINPQRYLGLLVSRDWADCWAWVGVLLQNPDGTIREDAGARFLLGQDGVVNTNLPIQMQQDSTVGDLALRSTLPEIRDLAKSLIEKAGGSGDLFDAAEKWRPRPGQGVPRGAS
jgi:hypothetical protein